MRYIEIGSEVARPVASPSFSISHILDVIDMAFDRLLAWSVSLPKLLLLRTLFSVEHKILNSLFARRTYHCVLVTPYNSLALQSYSALGG